MKVPLFVIYQRRESRMRKKLYNCLRLVLGIGLLVSLIPQVDAQTHTVNGLDYAPYTYFIHYDYLGEGNEFAEQQVTLEYGVDSEGYYQFVINNPGIRMAYVYRITDDGVYEEAYFPDAKPGVDYREEADARDDQRSLILPTEIQIGTKYQRGYRKEQTIELTDILEQFEVGGVRYLNVIELTVHDPDPSIDQKYYYAPKVGLLLDQFKTKTSETDEYVVTTTLNYFSGISQRLLEK